MEQPAAVVSDKTAPLAEMADTLEKVRDLLQERYGIEKGKVTMDADLNALGLDSLSLVEYAFDLEKFLNITLTDLPHELATVGDLVRYVDEVRKRSGTPIAA